MYKIKIFYCFIFFLASCTADKKQNNDSVKTKTLINKPTQESTKIKQPKQENSNIKRPTTNKQSNKANTKNKGNYYVELKRALNLSDLQTTKLKSIGTKYAKILKATSKANKEQIKKTKAKKQQEIKRLLGEKLYLRKIDFDQKF